MEYSEYMNTASFIDISKWIIIRASFACFGFVLFLYFYLDAKVPEVIPEKLKVKLMDAMMKTYGHMINFLISIGFTTPLSEFDRKFGDRVILTMITGKPWELGNDPRLQISDTKMRGVRVKIYEPIQQVGKKLRPVMIYLHGGGWSMLSVDSYDPLMRKLSIESDIIVISVNYRLSPQFPFPIPLQDCINVFEHVYENYDNLGIDLKRIAVGGDSAGGNMTAAITLRYKKEIAMQLLLVPVLQGLNWKTTSMIENVPYLHNSVNNPNMIHFLFNYLGIDPRHKDAFLTNKHTTSEFKKSKYYELVNQNIWLPRQYVRNENLIHCEEVSDIRDDNALFNSIKDKLTDPRAAPMLADDESLKNLPFTYIMTCGYDIIRDDGLMFYERLSRLREDVRLANFEDGFHNALLLSHGPLKMGVAVRIVDDIIAMLKAKL